MAIAPVSLIFVRVRLSWALAGSVKTIAASAARAYRMVPPLSVKGSGPQNRRGTPRICKTRASGSIGSRIGTVGRIGVRLLERRGHGQVEGHPLGRDRLQEPLGVQLRKVRAGV